MSKKITKINSLKKTEGFLQVNYDKGFKYLDSAGEFMNSLYETGNKTPGHFITPEGMRVIFSEKKEIKLSPYSLWLHFVEPISFDEQKKELLHKIDLVNSIIQPQKYTRIGWRCYLAYPCGENYPKILPDDILAGGAFAEVVFTKKINEFDSKISVSTAVNLDKNEKVILFDIDIYKIINIKRENFDEIKILIEKIEAAFNSDDLLDSVNFMLK